MNQEFKIDSFNKRVTIKRILGKVIGKNKTPTVIAIAGIHGNERAGVNALEITFNQIIEQNIPFKGNFYGILGNINALKNNVRFKNVDLNRIWTKQEVLRLHLGEYEIIESFEQLEVYKIIKEILSKEEGPFYFLDLHTTSSDTQPFITISDSLNNRKFSSNFSIPTILGIEEYLEGPLLTYINEFGHIALGFEAGQHTKEDSVDNCIAFLWLALAASKCVRKKDIKRFHFYKHTLSMFNETQEFYKIDFKYSIKPFEQFKMIKGYKNFQEIYKNELLAFSNEKELRANLDGKIFMPLYQQKGEDGYFIISKISEFWLIVSRLLRKLHLHNLLKLLPGVIGDKKNKYTLIVNPKTARFFAIEIFHLFGYRKKIIKNNNWYFTKRDRKISEFL